MSNKLFQNAVQQFQDVFLNQEIGVVDDTSTMVACTDVEKIGLRNEFYAVDFNESFDVFVRDGYTYKPFGGETKPEFAVFAEGEGETVKAQILSFSVTLELLKEYYDEKYDRNNFVKNIILDNVLPGEVGIKSRELHFNSDVHRVVMLIRTLSSADVSALDIIQNLFPEKNRDFIFSITETDVVLVKELKNNTDVKDLEKLAGSISDTLSSEFFPNVTIGIGTPANNIKDLAGSFKESQMAIEVGKVFDTDKNIICYSSLGIARLIYHLPTALCDAFLREVFKKGSIDSLDHETLFTIQKFFENNLNVSETSRKLFVHRNTLVYRLDKIKKLTGLDLREFEHAIIFKIALMVRKYLVNNPMKL